MPATHIISPQAAQALTRQAQEAIDAGLAIRAVVVATGDGFAVASATQSSMDASRIAALASTIATIGAVATQEAGLGACASLTLNADQGFAVLRHLSVEGKDLVLIMIAGSTAMLAQLLYCANQFARTGVAA